MEGALWVSILPTLIMWAKETWHVFLIAAVGCVLLLKLLGYTLRDVVRILRQPSRNARQVSKLLTAVGALDTKLDVLQTNLSAQAARLLEHERLCDARAEQTKQKRDDQLNELKGVREELRGLNQHMLTMVERVAKLEGRFMDR